MCFLYVRHYVNCLVYILSFNSKNKTRNYLTFIPISLIKKWRLKRGGPQSLDPRPQSPCRAELDIQSKFA